MKIITTIFYVVAVTLMLAVAALFVTPLLPIENNIQLRIVESGSMEPSIMTGAVVLIMPSSAYSVGDVITFDKRAAKVPTTHRIVETYKEGGQEWFITKGDANEEADTDAVAKRDVVGRVLFDAPYAGYVLDFSRQPVGFFFLIVLPALMIIFSEVEKIWSELRRKKGGAEDTDDNNNHTDGNATVAVEPPPARVVGRLMIDIATPVRYYHLWPTLDLRYQLRRAEVAARARAAGGAEWKTLGVGVLLAVIIVGTNFISSTVSYFNDTENSIGNILAAVGLDFRALADGEMFSFDEEGELLGDDDGALVTLVAPEGESVDMRYDITVLFKDGNPLFCDAIDAVSDNPPFAYDGSLSALAAEDVIFEEPWSLRLSLPSRDGFISGELCKVEVVYSAWYFDEATDQGYFDEEHVPLTFSLAAAPQAQVFKMLLGGGEDLAIPAQAPAEEEPKKDEEEGGGSDDGVDDPAEEEEPPAVIDEAGLDDGTTGEGPDLGTGDSGGDELSVSAGEEEEEGMGAGTDEPSQGADPESQLDDSGLDAADDGSEDNKADEAPAEENEEVV